MDPNDDKTRDAAPRPDPTPGARRDLEPDDADLENAGLDDAGPDAAGLDAAGLDFGTEGLPDLAAQAQQRMERLEKANEVERLLLKARSDHARLYADFENYRRRTSEDVLEAAGRGEARAIEAMLPILDDLSRAIEAGAGDPAGLLPGLRAVHDNFVKTLARLGVEPVPGKGEAFDPNVHEALTHVPGDEDGRVAEVYQPGFTLRGKLVRPARVVVTRR